jgi:hypothetical protein
VGDDGVAAAEGETVINAGVFKAVGAPGETFLAACIVTATMVSMAIWDNGIEVNCLLVVQAASAASVNIQIPAKSFFIFLFLFICKWIE